MPAFKMSVARISAGLAASALLTPALAVAAALAVNGERPLNITTPPGFTYVVTGADGSLSVPIDGFLFCANVYSGETPPPRQVTVVPQHGDWNSPVAKDIYTVGYNAGVLGVNRGLSISSLVCHSTGAGGEVNSPISDGVFSNGYETKTVEQFENLINWIPSPGFVWTQPNWALVPTDPCNPSVDQPAEVVEDVACAAVSGQRNAGAGATTRAPTMWTGTDGSNFFYVARVDARLGAQTGANGVDNFNFDQPQGSSDATLNVVNAYDRGVVGVGGGYLGDSGQWCVLFDLPTALDGNLCVGAPAGGTLSGTTLNDFQPIHLGVPPIGNPQVSFYLAFVRPIVGPPPSVNEPAVAVSILVEPSVSSEGGDKFKGDDVLFGFLPTSTGFPWMTGGQ